MIQSAARKGHTLTTDPRHITKTPPAPPPAPAATPKEYDDGLAVYGNWCGPGHGTPGAPVVDDIDQACKEHDEGYGENGYFDGVTDVKLIGALTKVQFTDDLSAKQRLAAAGMEVAIASLLPVDLNLAAGRRLFEGTKWIAPRLGEGIDAGLKVLDDAAKDAGSDVVSGFETGAGALAGAATAAGKSVGGALETGANAVGSAWNTVSSWF